MNEFLKKWKSDKKFKTSIQLATYTFFVIIVAIFAVSNTNSIPLNEVNNNQNQQTEKDNNKDGEIIEIPIQYNYLIKININEKEYKYSGTKTKEEEKIIKETDESITNYIYKNNSYYKEDEENNYLLTSKDEVYDIVNYNYLSLETINEYLTKAEKLENQYLVYLKDIILDNNSDDYIVININDNKINIDYTVLMKKFDESIEKYFVNIDIEEIE